MAIKFVKIIDDLLPKGKIWENQPTFNKIKNGLSKEVNRVYESITTFKQDFNIINSTNLATEHAKDYKLNTNDLSSQDKQYIINNYIYKDINFQDLILDFCNYLNVTVTAIKPPAPPQVGVTRLSYKLGYLGATGSQFAIVFNITNNVSCEDYKKVLFISDYFKPPHVEVLFTLPPTQQITYPRINPDLRLPYTLGLGGLCTI